MPRHWTDPLVNAGACRDAIVFGRRYRTFAAAWQACQEPVWLLWWASKCVGRDGSLAHKRLVRVACACARTALPFVPAGEDRPRVAIATAEAWTRGAATIQQVRQVRDAAAAAYAAAATTAAYAASATTVAYAAAAAAAVDAAAAAAATTAADAAAYAVDAAAAAKSDVNATLCLLIRRTYRVPPRRQA